MVSHIKKDSNSIFNIRWPHLNSENKDKRHLSNNDILKASISHKRPIADHKRYLDKILGL